MRVTWIKVRETCAESASLSRPDTPDPVARQVKTAGSGSGCRSCRKVTNMPCNRLRGSTPDLLLGFTPLAFFSPEISTRQWSYLTHSWGLVHTAPGRIHAPVGLHTVCLGANLLRVLVVQPESARSSVSRSRCGESLHRACKWRGCVLAEEDLRTRLPFSHENASQRC